jgi:hypothetical protein
VQIRKVATTEERDALLGQIEEQVKEQKAKLKLMRAAQNESQATLSAVYDLKAVNPNAPDTRERRTPDELLAIIEEAQLEISAGIQALRSRKSS